MRVFGIVIVYLQIAVLLSSVSVLMRKKPLWYCGMLVDAVGLGYFGWAFFVMPG